MSDENDDLPEGMTSEHDPEFAARMRKFEEDYVWMLNQTAFRDRYGGRAVIWHNRQVLGEGQTHEEAEEDARRKAAERHESLPPASELYVFLVPARVWFGYSLTDCLDLAPPQSEPVVPSREGD